MLWRASHARRMRERAGWSRSVCEGWRATNGRAPSPALAAATTTTEVRRPCDGELLRLDKALAVVKEAGAAGRPLISVLQKESTGITQGPGTGYIQNVHCPTCRTATVWAGPCLDATCSGTPSSWASISASSRPFCACICHAPHHAAGRRPAPSARRPALQSWLQSLPFWGHAGAAMFQVDTPG
ncbi:hypothetical protein P171DRAFT_503433 [Karstenula rhodostoma CBS 690.94]|uniref:Uncharacterized protein n=1 Tax=Karstenula rhodostoma CBS 690.94 TaxID=1392251 RepID=A0A9P4PSX2_9PLEO|nr:hypothetical protein P171DRAFT_503433 [Karstenula rhodostoma CBS 690.94]